MQRPGCGGRPGHLPSFLPDRVAGELAGELAKTGDLHERGWGAKLSSSMGFTGLFISWPQEADELDRAVQQVHDAPVMASAGTAASTQPPPLTLAQRM